MVVFGQKLLYSGKSDCIRGKWLCSGKWLFLVKVFVFGQKLLCSSKNGCIRAKWLYSDKSCCNQGKSGGIRANVVIFEQSDCVLEKVVVIGKSGCMRES